MVPRLVLAGLFLFTGYLEPAFHTKLWPVLGFLFMPLTTLAYAYAKHASGSIDGWYLALVIFAATIDLGLWGHGGWRGRGYRLTRIDR
jgi:hypothetical protein